MYHEHIPGTVRTISGTVTCNMYRECLLEYARGPDPFRFKHESVYMYRVHAVHVHTNK